MKSEAYSYSTIEIANSFDGRAAVFAVDYRVNAVVELTEGKKIFFKDKSYSRFRENVKEILNYFGCDYGCNIEVRTEIPADSGLGLDEAVTSAIMLAVCGALTIVKGAIYELKIDKYMKEQVIEIDGRFVNTLDLVKEISGKDLRFDRLFSSCLGGFIIADNEVEKILRRGEMESLFTSLIIPRKVKEKKFNEKLHMNEAEVIFTEALRGNLYTAMKLNGLLYNREKMEAAMSSGALTATANREGVVAALSRDKKTAGKISDKVYAVANCRAAVVGKPKKIIKVNEFLRLKGREEFYWI